MAEPERGGPVERISDILSRVLREEGLADPRKQGELDAAWRDVAGSDVARRTALGPLRSGVLVVHVESSALRQELEVFQREELLRALRVRLPGVFVEEIRFRLS